MIRIIKKDEIQSSHWTGGTTTELFIFPNSASYNKMDFDFRISTATIEADESTFTSLKDVRRTLMVLEGSLELIHNNQAGIVLKPFQQDSFMGDWQTISRGLAVDFNLMLRDSTLSEQVEAISVKQNASITFAPEKHGFIYLYKGNAVLNKEVYLTSGHSVYFDEFDPITLLSKSKLKIIYVTLQ